MYLRACLESNLKSFGTPEDNNDKHFKAAMNLSGSDRRQETH